MMLKGRLQADAASFSHRVLLSFDVILNIDLNSINEGLP